MFAPTLVALITKIPCAVKMATGGFLLPSWIVTFNILGFSLDNLVCMIFYIVASFAFSMQVERETTSQLESQEQQGRQQEEHDRRQQQETRVPEARVDSFGAEEEARPLLGKRVDSK